MRLEIDIPDGTAGYLTTLASIHFAGDVSALVACMIQRQLAPEALDPEPDPAPSRPITARELWPQAC